MGFFDDFKEDLSQAVDELNSTDVEKDVMPEDVPVPEPTFDFGGDSGETTEPDLQFDAKEDVAEEPLIDVAPLEEIAIEEPATEPEFTMPEPEAAPEPESVTESEETPEPAITEEAVAEETAETEPELSFDAEIPAEPESETEPEAMPEPEAVAEPEAMPEPESFAEPEAAPAEEMPAEETPAEEAPAAPDTDIFAGIDNELTDTAAEAEDNVDERNEQMDTFNEDIIEGLGLPELEEGPEVDENGSITAGMTINGDITSGGSLEVIGTVKGNINVRGKLNVSGSITGNSKAAEIFADSAKVIGEMISSGAVKVGQESVIIGNISATSAVIAGAVKGDIDVKGPVILDTSAIVMGDIKSKSVQINNGAVIEGHCSQCYAEVSPTSFFEDVKGAIDKKK